MECYICKQKENLIELETTVDRLWLSKEATIICKTCNGEYIVEVSTKLYLKEICYKSANLLSNVLLVLFFILTFIGFNFNFDYFPKNEDKNKDQYIAFGVAGFMCYYFQCFFLRICMIDYKKIPILKLLFAIGIVNIMYHLIGSYTIFIFNPTWHSKLPLMFWYTLLIGSMSVTIIGIFLCILYNIINAIKKVLYYDYNNGKKEKFILFTLLILLFIILIVLFFLTAIGCNLNLNFNFYFNFNFKSETKSDNGDFLFFIIITFLCQILQYLIFTRIIMDCAMKQFTKHKIDYMSSYILSINITIFFLGLLNIIYHLIGNFVIFIFSPTLYSKLPPMFYYTYLVGSISITIICLSLLILYLFGYICIQYMKPNDKSIIIRHV
jgi:hypothetical protein